jgi:hypothetical protein
MPSRKKHPQNLKVPSSAPKNRPVKANLPNVLAELRRKRERGKREKGKRAKGEKVKGKHLPTTPGLYSHP